MTQQAAQRMMIKGIREGLLIAFPSDSQNTPFELLLRDLTEELDAKKDFLRGSRVALAFGEQTLSREQLADIQALLAGQGMALWAILTGSAETKVAARQLGLATRLPGSNTDLDGNMREPADANATEAEPALEPSVGSQGLLLKETIRSGRSIFHEGHVVVIGDVNPGAEIIAGGDVVVWGKLRGLVHAGALGDTTAVICALELIPTQLRIADQIAIAPDGRRRQPIPEMAAIRQGQIVAEPWQMR